MRATWTIFDKLHCIWCSSSDPSWKWQKKQWLIKSRISCLNLFFLNMIIYVFLSAVASLCKPETRTHPSWRPEPSWRRGSLRFDVLLIDFSVLMPPGTHKLLVWSQLYWNQLNGFGLVLFLFCSRQRRNYNLLPRNKAMKYRSVGPHVIRSERWCVCVCVFYSW